MTDHSQALDAAITAAGLDPRNPAVREASATLVEKYIEGRNSEAVAWTSQGNIDGVGKSPKETWSIWGKPNGLISIPLFLAPSASGETVKARLQSISDQITALKPSPAATDEYSGGYTDGRYDAWLIVQEIIDNAE
ncbi:hypothetical protein GGE68_001388 [Rhizobium leguminosarum]|uniref:hypothetical protein n=1 Tax=Rhizobium leguminosarum TaxID=384 RepID=UPI0016179DFF|nr:hypothetical protein [Rhizobium leguminosarum]MBB5663212.1 hypothetical protein [Rhizobium leguminosarum]